MARISEMHKKWMKQPKYRKAYEALEEEFALASAVPVSRKRNWPWKGDIRWVSPKDMKAFRIFDAEDHI